MHINNMSALTPIFIERCHFNSYNDMSGQYYIFYRNRTNKVLVLIWVMKSWSWSWNFGPGLGLARAKSQSLGLAHKVLLTSLILFLKLLFQMSFLSLAFRSNSRSKLNSPTIYESRPSLLLQYYFLLNLYSPGLGLLSDGYLWY